MLAAIVLGVCSGSDRAVAGPASRDQRARIIVLKVDGLPGVLVKAGLAPQKDALLRLPIPG
ncbi:MAG: hypothetical protein OXI92_05370, partial [Acidobacteriota bacterium]|nr:hypothetical protein [Acidobacteriota bacterium]